MTDTTAPRQIVWPGPNGHHVILDEDGVSLRPGGLLEEAEINRLLSVINEAKKCRDAGTAPVPVRPDLPF
jgi:hypothetical protein